MKLSGNYNPVTEGAGGSMESSKMDYQEGRKNVIFYLIILVAIGVAVWYFLGKWLASLVPSAGNVAAGIAGAVSGASEATVKAVKAANQASIDTVVRAAGKQPGEAATQAYWDAANRYLGESAISTTAISAGNVILSTPVINSLGQPLLAQATIAGQDFRQDLDSYGDYDRLENDPLRGLIVTGEGLSRTFTGFSPYEAGKSFARSLQGQ